MSLVRRVVKAVKAPFSKKKEPTEATMPASVAEAVAAIIEANTTPSIPENAASPAPLGVYLRAKKAKWAQIKQLRDLLYETRAALRTKWRTNSNRTTTEQNQLASEHIRNARMIKDAVRQTIEELLELCRTVASYVAVAQNAFTVTCSYIAHSLTFYFLLYFYFWTYYSHPDLQVVSDDASTRTVDTVSESSYIGYSLDEEIHHEQMEADSVFQSRTFDSAANDK